MTRGILGVLLAGALALTLAPPAHADKDFATAVAAGVVGVAVGAALSKHHHHHKGHFSPAAGIECYTSQRACYHADGGFAAHWTQQVFG